MIPIFKIVLTIVIYFLMDWTSSLWLPLISWLVNFVVTIGISWFIARFVAKTFLFKKVIPPVDPAGKAILITGCDTGFGHMTAIELNGLGFHVIATVYDEASQGAKELVKKSLYKDKMEVIQMNVTKCDQVLQVASTVGQYLEDKQVTLYALINNAGIASGGHIEWIKPGSVEDFESLLQVNTLGVIRVTRAFLPFIRKSQGRVVNLSSILGKTNLPGLSAYCVSKAATAKFTEGLQSELTGFGVTAVDVEPWFYKTPMLNPVVIVDNMKRKWTEATAEVRDAYGGDNYLSRMIHGAMFLVSHPKTVVDTPEDVVNTLIDAVTSPEPDTVYRVISPGFGIIFWIVNDFLPWDILIHVRRVLDVLPHFYSLK